MTLPLPLETNHRTDGQKPRILIVDDTSAARELLKVILGFDYHVETVDSGEAALKTLRGKSFDLVLLDIMMKGISGLEVLTTLRQADATRELPVILVSALSQSEIMVEGLEAGANDYIQKPIDPAVLLARVKTQIKLKLLTDERQRHIQKLEDAEHLRVQFSRIASHDLKNPLNNVAMASVLLNDEIGNNPRVTQILKMLDLTVENMNHIIEAFLDVVALQSDTMKIRPMIIQISDVLNNVATQYEIAAEEKDIQLQIGASDGMVLADNARLVQVVNNLVSNAIKYSPPGSTVRLWTDIQNDTVRICVQDEGPGVPLEERKLLFTEFGKLTPRPTANEPSTGLGLWIVKHLIQKQGGRVGTTFPNTGGSIFWLELPELSASSEELNIEETA